MNYGYNERTKDWKPNRQMALAFELAKELGLVIGWAKAEVHSPYIEVDGAYGGVRIRRITHLSEKEHDKLIDKADKTYKVIMEMLI